MGKLPLFLVVIASLNGCVSQGVREHVELQMNGTIGKLPSETYFHGSPVFKCDGNNGQDGCLLKDIYGCTIWFKVDRASGRISAWEYVGRPEKCWGFHGA